MPLLDIGLIWNTIPVSGVLVQHIIENSDLLFGIVLHDDPGLTHRGECRVVISARLHRSALAKHVRTDGRNTISGIDLYSHLLPVTMSESTAESSAQHFRNSAPSQSSANMTTGQMLVYLFTWRLRLALEWRYGKDAAAAADDDDLAAIWSTCFVAELVSVQLYNLPPFHSSDLHPTLHMVAIKSYFSYSNTLV